ncbi:MAG: tRNA dihydrouridine synthase DusB [Planctomycetes bacterium]|nr:tRNA dihydrouridine synthase DusB [Planctomycetota bacterium]
MRSELNAQVHPARPGEFAPLRLGALVVDPPVVLAPMAGVTNVPFRTLCRRFSADRCLYVSEMITARSFARQDAKTLRLAAFGPEESTRSIQLYGTHPGSLGEAARILAADWGVDHIDMNFGCPVRKVTAAGGGAAIPARPRLLARLVRAVVARAGDVPVTIKFRIGIDEDVTTYLDAGRVAEAEGCRAVALHGRTAAQLYNGDADWHAIGTLKAAVTTIPVLGNGDVFECWDALRMMRETGCDGVVVGRGCLGRPWLFRELCAVFDGTEPEPPPTLGAVAATLLLHADLLIDHVGERVAIQQMRKFAGWYLKSFPGVKALLPELHRIATRADLGAALDRLLAATPASTPFPAAALRVRRAKGGRTQRVALPDGYLDDRESDEPPRHDPGDAELAELSGG